MLQVGELAAQISEDLDREDANSFVTPTKSVGAEPMDDQEPLSEEAFLPLSQKLSLSPLHDEEVSASASELLYSELSDKKSELDQKSKLLKEAQEQVRDYKLKCEALMSSLSASKKRQREEAQGRLPEAHADAAPRKKPSPEHAPKVPKPVAQKAADAAAPANLSDDEVPPPTPKPVALDFKFANPYERLQSILCAYKAKQVIPGSDELPFDLCALIVKEEADAVEKWSKRTCSEFHEPVIAALKLVYPNKVDAWFEKPFLCSPTGAAKYWSKVLSDDRKSGPLQLKGRRRNLSRHPSKSLSRNVFEGRLPNVKRRVSIRCLFHSVARPRRLLPRPRRLNQLAWACLRTLMSHRRMLLTCRNHLPPPRLVLRLVPPAPLVLPRALRQRRPLTRSK